MDTDLLIQQINENIFYKYSIGGKIKRIRQLKGLTQKELGIKCGFSETTAVQRISQYEKNLKTPKPGN